MGIYKNLSVPIEEVPDSDKYGTSVSTPSNDTSTTTYGLLCFSACRSQCASNCGNKCASACASSCWSICGGGADDLTDTEIYTVENIIL